MPGNICCKSGGERGFTGTWLCNYFAYSSPNNAAFDEIIDRTQAGRDSMILARQFATMKNTFKFK